jgi:hypothetical protein
MPCQQCDSGPSIDLAVWILDPFERQLRERESHFQYSVELISGTAQKSNTERMGMAVER